MQLRIALCQTDIAWEQPAQNLARLEPLVAGVDADVVVLSELFATGFTLDPAPVAEAPGGEVVTALRRWAVQYGKAVAGSVAVAEGGRFFNRMYFVTPDGGCARYDKRHLFAPGGESRNSSAMTCGSRFGAAAAGITTPSCAVHRGPRRGARRGGRCCTPGLSRINATSRG